MERILIGGQAVPVPAELREAPDYRAAVAAWHKAELESRGLPHVLMPAAELEHLQEQPDGSVIKVRGGHRGPGVLDADAPVEVPSEVATSEAAARDWVVAERERRAKEELKAQQAREQDLDETTGQRRPSSPGGAK